MTPAAGEVAAAAEMKARLMANPYIERAVRIVRQDEDASATEGPGFRSRFHLPPEAWAKFAQLAGI